ncbi:MAG TPA: hypothetical protein VHQ64_06355 [Pyrinomonadaceae bacterium]|jgi:hypothetical protein|nr:hypothetical protein [Pyrinomonadaceae bacterium]
MATNKFRAMLMLLVMTLACARATDAQQANGKENRYVVVPPESCLLFVASQPGSPIRFEDMKLVARLDHRQLTVSGTIRNVSAKPIRYLNIALGGSGGGVSTLGGPGPMSGALVSDLLMPGAELNDPEPPRIVPLTEELRRSLELQAKSPKGFFVLMVVRVTFADGTKYEDQKTTDLIGKYLDFLAEGEEASAKSPDTTNGKRVSMKRPH